MTDKFYITTPIYYVNDRPHIGHVYTTTIADIIARYHRLRGDDVFFLTGVDEHAAKVVDAAAQRGLTPQQWADRNAAVFEETFRKLGITHNDFVRTSQDRHKTRVQEYLAALLKTGDVYEGTYEGWYDAGQEEYVTDSKAEEYGFKSPINGKPLVRKGEKNYFFRLESYRDDLLRLLDDEHPQGRLKREDGSFLFDVQPTARKNEIISRIREMNDVPISRSGAGGWGIPFPTDPQQTVYVWIDALFNYLTFVDTPDRRGYWQSGATHLIAKDILWFHAAIWPALLIALRKCEGYDWVTLPRTVYAHSFWISEGQKMSKSLGNFIDLEKIDKYVATFSLDALRYFLGANGPMGTTDSDFAEAKFGEVYNTALANTLGNCFSRVCNMTHRYFQGSLPAKGTHFRQPFNSNDLAEHNATNNDIRDDLDADGFEDALQAPARWSRVNYRTDATQLDLEMMGMEPIGLIQAIDGLIEQTAPFKLAKDPAKLPEVGTILYNCAEALRIASILLWPIIPAKCEEIWRRIGCSHYAEALKDNGRGQLAEWVKWGQLKPGTPLQTGDALFPRYAPPKA